MSDRITCGLCSSPAVKGLYTIRGIDLKQCEDCGAIFVYPPSSFEELLSGYQEQYFQSGEHLEWGYEDYFRLEEEVRETARRRLQVMSNYVSGGKLLESGCATGWFLDEAARQGFDVQGVEISRFASEWGRENLGLRIFTGTLSEARLADEEFDVVVLWDVLEHLTEPLAELNQISRILKSGGYLFVSIPDAGSFWARAMGNKWFGYAKIREHIFYYDRRSIAKVMSRAGFEIVRMQSSPFLVSMDFLVSKLAQYSETLARLIDRLLHVLGLRKRMINLRNVDLMVAARKESHR